LAEGFTLASRTPKVDRTIPIAQSDSLVQARTAYRLLDPLAVVLPWASLLLLAAGVAMAGRKARALAWAGLGLGLSMALLAASVAFGRLAFIGTVSPAYLPGDVARRVYDAIVPLLSATALTVGLAGVAVAVAAQLAGPLRRALQR
jgi:hypothetical protein